jgi:hypothetical protein
MSSKNNVVYHLRKVEHEFTLPKIVPKFEKMPELYLELLINKKKVNSTLASEKYIHNYDEISDMDSLPDIIDHKTYNRINEEAECKQLPLEKNEETYNNRQPLRKETFTWESSASMEPSPVRQRPKISPVKRVTSSNVSVSSEKYKKVKKSIISSYYKESQQQTEQKKPEHQNQRDNTEKKPLTVNDLKKMYGEKDIMNDFTDYETAKDEDDQKRELLFKFNRLKKTYPKVDMPEFNMMSNHENMKKTYDSTIKNLAIDSTVESYKSYLMMGFMGCEVTLGKIGFDMEGYTQQQTLYMNKYEKLLIELGEKSYVPSSINKWPVEIRLMALILFQTTIFIVSKIIAKKTNVNLLQMYNNVNGAYEQQSKKNNSSGYVSGGSSPLTFIPKRPPTSVNSESRMKGPSITREN